MKFNTESAPKPQKTKPRLTRKVINNDIRRKADIIQKKLKTITVNNKERSFAWEKGDLEKVELINRTNNRLDAIINKAPNRAIKIAQARLRRERPLSKKGKLPAIGYFPKPINAKPYVAKLDDIKVVHRAPAPQEVATEQPITLDTPIVYEKDQATEPITEVTPAPIEELQEGELDIAAVQHPPLPEKMGEVPPNLPGVEISIEEPLTEPDPTILGPDIVSDSEKEDVINPITSTGLFTFEEVKTKYETVTHEMLNELLDSRASHKLCYTELEERLARADTTYINLKDRAELLASQNGYQETDTTMRLRDYIKRYKALREKLNELKLDEHQIDLFLEAKIEQTMQIPSIKTDEKQPEPESKGKEDLLGLTHAAFEPIKKDNLFIRGWGVLKKFAKFTPQNDKIEPIELQQHPLEEEQKSDLDQAA
jgi:hypothetical protein